MINIYIIDDHQIIIDGIISHLKSNTDIAIVGSATDPLVGIEALQNIKIDIILLDISMPQINGLICAERILNNIPSARIIFLSTHMETSIIKKAIKLGAKGYVSKSTGINTIDEAIKKVHNGEMYLAPEISTALLMELTPSKVKSNNYSVIPKLTNREKEVLVLIANELTTEEISRKLFISKNTVETHRKNLISKFQVRNSVGLVKTAMELEMI